MENIQSSMDNILSNPTSYGLLALFLGIYGPRLHPKLPPVIKDLFNNNVFRFSIIVLIIFLSSKDLSASLIVAVAFLLVISIANSQEMQEQFLDKYSEGYSNFDSIKEFYDDDDDNEYFQAGPEIETFTGKDPTEEFEGADPTEEFEGADPTEEFEGADPTEEFEGADPTEEFEGADPTEEFEGADPTEEFTNFNIENYYDKNKKEEFTTYERHLYDVVNKYKFGN
jgi:hypothetical protein